MCVSSAVLADLRSGILVEVVVLVGDAVLGSWVVLGRAPYGPSPQGVEVYAVDSVLARSAVVDHYGEWSPFVAREGSYVR